MSTVQPFNLSSPADALPLSGLFLAPESPKAVVQLSHGMSEHKERYLPFMEFLSQRGYAAVIHDHRGHGASLFPGDQEALGYMGGNGAQAIVEDLHAVTQLAKERWPGLPLFLFGHSMGSLVARCYAQRYDRELTGLIVCGSPSNNPGAIPGRALAKLLTLFYGEHHRSALIQKMAFGSFNSKVDHPESSNSWICANPQTVSDYDNDPLCGFVFTLNGFTALFNLVQQTYRPQNWQVQNPNMPVLFIAGEADPCILSPQKFDQAVNLVKSVGYLHVSSILYPQMRHELLNEAESRKVMEDVLAFLEKAL